MSNATAGVNGLELQDAIRALLAGATIVQVASVILKHGIPYISTILCDIEAWMAEKSYATLDDFRGKVSQKHCDDPFAFERAQYVRLLLSQ